MHQRHAVAGNESCHFAALRRLHEVLHLHRFEDGDLLPWTDQVSLRHLDGDDRALQRRWHRHRSRWASDGPTAFGGCNYSIRGAADSEEQRPRGFLRCADQGGDVRIDETGADAVGDEIGMREHRLKEWNIGGDAFDAEFTQRTCRLPRHIGPVRGSRMNDDLGEQGIERSAGLVPRVAEAIDPHARAGRRIEHRQRPAGRLGHTLLIHHFHVDAKLHRVATRRWHCGLRQAERGKSCAGGNRELRLHQIDAKHLLGHGMLDLQARIGLDEGKGLISRGCFAVDQEFERAEIVVMRRGRELFCGVDDPRTQGIAQRWAWRYFDQLLVTPLDRAFTLPQMADRPMAVADDLHFDMAGLADQALDIDLIASEGGLRLGLTARIGLLQL